MQKVSRVTTEELMENILFILMQSCFNYPHTIDPKLNHGVVSQPCPRN